MVGMRIWYVSAPGKKIGNVWVSRKVRRGYVMLRKEYFFKRISDFRTSITSRHGRWVN